MALLSRVGNSLDVKKKAKCIIVSEDARVECNATLDVSESYSAQVTSYQIENGTNVSDHVHPNPETIALNAILSNDDVDYSNPLNAFEDTAEDKKKQLIKWLQSGTRLDIQYGKLFFSDYVMTGFSPAQNAEVGKNYSTAISFQKIIIATVQTKQINKGKTPTVNAPKKSILAGIFK